MLGFLTFLCMSHVIRSDVAAAAIPGAACDVGTIKKRPSGPLLVKVQTALT